MNTTDKKFADQLEDSIYEVPKFKKYQLILILAGTFLFTFIYYFPLKPIVEAGFNKVILSQPNCPISYSKLNLSFFMPGIELLDANIPGSCFQNPESSMHLNIVELNPYLPTLIPPGIRFRIQTNKGKSEINVYPALTLTGQIIEIDNTKIQLADFVDLAPQLNYLSGEFEIESKTRLQEGQVQSANVLIESENLKSNSFDVMGLNIPSLDLKRFMLKGTLDDKRTFDVETLEIGEEKAPIRLQLKGKILVNSSNPRFSRVDLAGELFISAQIMQQFPILVPMMENKKKNPNGAYPLRLTGTFAQMNPPAFQ